MASRFLSILTFCLLATPICFGEVKQASPPNILLILTDDQGYGDLSIYGNQFTETPNLEAFAKESVVFKNFHAQPVCSPTRAELMTGRWFLEVGVWGVHGGREYLNLEHQTIANYLTNAGYNSAMIGKWHLGKTAAYLPYHRGFEESWSSTDRLYEHTDPVFDHNGKSMQVEGWTSDIISGIAIDYMKRERNNPFFLYVAYPEVHEPWYAPDDLVEKYLKKGVSKSLATVFAMNEQLDASIGKLLTAVDKEGLSEDTVVIFVGDNGPIYSTSNGLADITKEEMALRNPESLRGFKGNLYENGTRVPGMIRWPGRFNPHLEMNSVDVIDIVPTIIELADVPSTANRKLRGQSLMPMLTGNDPSELTRPAVYANHDTLWPERKRLYSFLHDKEQIDFNASLMAIRNGNYKIVQAWSRRELFDLENDPSELKDLSQQLPNVFKRMGKQLDDTFAEIYSTQGTYDLPTFPIGLPEVEETFLYACAPKEIFGEVVTQSHSVDDFCQVGDGLEWEIEVLAEGEYLLELRMVPGKTKGLLTLSINGEDTLIKVSNSSVIELGRHQLELGKYPVKLVLSMSEDTNLSVIKRLHGISIAK